MADASKALPVSHIATLNQLVAVRDWHHNQITFLDHNNGPSRDERAIIRSEGTIKNINTLIQVKGPQSRG